MSDTDSTTAAESPEPFTGDRGWKGLERSEGEGAFFAIVAALLVVALLALVLTGVAGLGLRNGRNGHRAVRAAILAYKSRRAGVYLGAHV